MSHPWVYSVTLAPGKLILHVEVTDLKATDEAIEITGEVTQANGALAQISCIKDWKDAIPGDPSDEKQRDKYFMDVDAVRTGEVEFSLEEGPITIFVRVSKTWVTVLGPGTDEPNGGKATAPTWAIYQADGQLNSSAGGGYQTPA